MAEFPSVCWVRAGSFPHRRGLCEVTVNRDVVEFEADDPAECGQRLVAQLIEDPSVDRFVAPSARVMSDTWRSRIASMSTQEAPVVSRIINPRNRADQRSGAVTPERIFGWLVRQERLDGLPQGITTSGSSARMMGPAIHRLLGWFALGIKPEPTPQPVDSPITATYRRAPLRQQSSQATRVR